ncbi:MAG: hypothetical protein GXN99_02030 [Candidatus Nanohaloarchaeota archaeon]|nr:hypothetical protein [Candidatus Nanohaloarchaeota archaeon]
MNPFYKRKSILLSAVFLITFYVYSSQAYASTIQLQFFNDLIEKGDSATGIVRILVNESGEYFVDIYALGYESWITITPSNAFYASPEKPVVLNITFSAPSNAKPGSYSVYVYLKDKEGNLLGYDKRIVYVLDAPDLKIEEIKLKDPSLERNEPLGIYLILRNYGKVDASGYMVKITIPKLNLLKSYTIPVVKKESEDTYYVEVDIGKAEAGKYEAFIELIDYKDRVVDKKEVSFEVIPYNEIKETIKEEFNFFRKIQHINVVNEGNAPGTYEYVIPTYLPFIYDLELDEGCGCEYVYENKELVVRCEVQPNQSCSLKIVRNNWMEYLALIAMILLLILIFWVYTTPSIKKHHYKKGHKYKVIITIKNRHFRTPLREVVVKDKVNGLLKIVEESIIPKPSRIKKLKDYSLIEWHINELKPGEERIITYEVIPKIDVEGDIKMHEAEMEGKIRNKKKKAKAKSEKK